MAVYTFQGVTITFSSSFFTNITNVDWSGITRDAVPTSSASTAGGKSYIPSNLYDPGEITVEGRFDNTANFTTPIAGAAETITVTKLASGQSTGGTIAASGFMTSWRFGGPADDTPETVNYTATLKLSDEITFTAGS